MDANCTEIVHFTLTPVETIVACNQILLTIDCAIRRGRTQMDTGDIGNTCLEGRELYQQTQTWPLITLHQSPTHRLIHKLHELASFWLECSPLFEANDGKSKKLKQYLKWQPGFSATGLGVNNDGTVKNRNMIPIQQPIKPAYKMASTFDFCIEEDYMLEYCKFRTEMIWRLGDPLRRMFAWVFEGEYREIAKEDDHRGVSQQFGNPSVVDHTHTVAMNTPSTTRAFSPAVTNINHAAEAKPVKLPTLKYVAIIETDTDEALFNLDGSDIDWQKHAVLNKAKDMCTEMVSKGYGSKIRLQDIMDVVVNMEGK